MAAGTPCVVSASSFVQLCSLADLVAVARTPATLLAAVSLADAGVSAGFAHGAHLATVRPWQTRPSLGHGLCWGGERDEGEQTSRSTQEEERHEGSLDHLHRESWFADDPTNLNQGARKSLTPLANLEVVVVSAWIRRLLQLRNRRPCGCAIGGPPDHPMVLAGGHRRCRCRAGTSRRESRGTATNS